MWYVFVIGKKGANIQMLRSEYSANIKLPDSPGPERIFSVAAADAEIVADIIGKVFLGKGTLDCIL